MSGKPVSFKPGVKEYSHLCDYTYTCIQLTFAVFIAFMLIYVNLCLVSVLWFIVLMTTFFVP